MKIFATFLTAIAVFAALGSAGPAAAGGRRICAGPPNQWMGIQPGGRIGRFHLGAGGIENLKEHTTKPYATESDQSGTYQAWKWGQDFTFFVHEVPDTANGAGSSGLSLDLIGFTYPRDAIYRVLGTWISTGSTLEEIRKRFPGAQPVANAPTVYDDVQQGIAFEFEKEATPQSACIAIMVHLPGQSRVMTLEQVNELLKKGSEH
jgi:hypothetical protein